MTQHTLDMKRLVRGQGDLNQIAPIKYEWAWDWYGEQNKNHWMPHDIPMGKDVSDYKLVLNDAERHIFVTVLATLTTSDVLALRNIGLAIMEKITAPEVQLGMSRQIYDESVHCYIEGTEILTNRGWLDFRDLKEDDLFAQYHEDGSITFTPSVSYTADDFDGELYEFSSSYHHLLVTPRHRCVAIDPRDEGKLKIIRAEDFYPANFNIPCAGFLNPPKARRHMSSLERLQVAFQADGMLMNKHSNGGLGTGYRFAFKKQRKVLRLRKLLEEMNIPHSVSEWRDYTHISFHRRDLALSKDFEWINITEISHSWIREFIDELTHWDGCRSGGQFRYCTTNELCYQKVSQLAPLAGYRMGIHVSNVDGQLPYYTVNFVDKRTVTGRVIDRAKRHYTGKVYSVGVPSSMLVVRYNDLVAISGNTITYQHCIEGLSLDQEEIYTMYRRVPEIKGCMDLANKYLRAAIEIRTLDTREQLIDFLYACIFFTTIFEGTWFYNGFSPLLAFQRRNLMPGAGEQIQYIARDEIQHVRFGMHLIRGIMQEENIALDPARLRVMFHEAYAVRTVYAGYVFRNEMLGITKATYLQNEVHMMNRRLKQLGVVSADLPFPETESGLPWLDEQIGLIKEASFFEVRSKNYQVGGLNWADDPKTPTAPTLTASADSLPLGTLNW